ncbi:MAG TPA: MraY family glycosyltransferase [bacterium]|nr:MraY family glycosyltransferase [bacterium]
MYILYFIGTGLGAWLLTLGIRKIALRFNILDYPTEERKQHTKAIPLLGGIAIFIALALALFFGKNIILSGNLEPHHWLGVLIGGGFIMIGGFLDDKYKLPPGLQILFPLLAALAVIIGGVGIEKITNPSGDFFYLNQLEFPIFIWQGKIFYFNLIADSFTILWLLGMSYTTKLLDGVDGLVGSITAVASLVIFLFTTTTRWQQDDIAFASLMLLAACLGFLIVNWHPAKIFLGEGGSLFLGFMLGVLSIISGGKIAIALLIMGIPVLDVIWTIIRRSFKGKNPFKFADREHLHFRLLDAGMSPRLTVLAFCLVSFIFGLSALFLQSKGKIYSLIILFILMISLLGVFKWLDRRRIVG